VDWTHNVDVQNRMKTEIEDYLFNLKDQHGILLTLEDIDQILDHCIDIARVRRAQ
jgi:phosphate uptake regulator